MRLSTDPHDCMHQAMGIEPDAFRCSGCGLRFERKSAAQHIADMRALLGNSHPSRQRIGPARIHDNDDHRGQQLALPRPKEDPDV